MKLFLEILCLVLLLEVYNCDPLNSTEDAREPVELSTLCLQVAGNKSDKSPILLLHGLYNFKETWYPLIQHLVTHTGRKVCAADLRNHGESPWSNEFNTAVMAKDVEYLLEKYNFEKVVLLGHSLGGKTAVHFALTHPEKVEKLIVEDMRPNGMTDDPTLQNMMFSFRDAAENALESIPENATEAEAKRAVYTFYVNMLKQMNETFEFDDAIVNYYPITCSNGTCRWKSNMEELNKALLNFNATIPPSQGEFNGPSLFIYGGKSHFNVGEAREEILKMFPNAELVEIKDATHMVNLNPEYKNEILKFILK